MADFDYAAVQADAQALITEFGGDVVLVALNGAVTDPIRPWETLLDPRTGAAQTTVRAVQVEPDSAKRLGLAVTTEDMLKRADRILMVAGNDAINIRDYDEVNSADGPYKIGMIHELNPSGAKPLLWFLELSKR